MTREKQSMLFDAYEQRQVVQTPPIARRVDPRTSHEAAANLEASGQLAGNEQAALALVRLHPGRTGAELDNYANAKKREVSKRLAGLAQKGVIRRGDDDEIRVCSVTKNNCVVWWPES